MSRYSDEDREKVRDAVDMVALVEGRTQLKRAGAARVEGDELVNIEPAS